VVIPEVLRKRSLVAAIRRGPSFFLKVRLLREPGVVVTDVPVLREKPLPREEIRPMTPRTVVALVFVSGGHDGAIRAINYARSLRATETRAVFFALDPTEIHEIQNEWLERRIPVELDIVEAPFRDMSQPILAEVRRVTADPDALAWVVVPELVVKKWHHNLLHNNRALFIKRLLLFEERVILSSVPYHLR